MPQTTKPRKVMPVAEWPSIDRECWEHALAGGDDGDGPAIDWELDTQSKVWRAWGRLLQWQADSGELRPGTSPGERLAKVAVKVFASALKQRLAPNSAGMIVMALADAARVMLPDGEWAWIRRLARAITRDAASVRDPATAFVDPALIGRLGIRTMEEAGSPAGYGVGLILVLLALVPALRSRALRSLRIDDLAFNSDRYRLTIRAKTKKVKRRTTTVPLPPQITPFIDRWLQVHRSALINNSKPTDALMLTSAGNPYSRAKLWAKVAGLTKSGLGVRVGPHRIRHCSATWIAIRTPEHVMDTRYVLDQASHRTSQKYYNLASSIEASQRHNDTMLKVVKTGLLEPVVALDPDQQRMNNPSIRFPRPRRANGTSSWRRQD